MAFTDEEPKIEQPGAEAQKEYLSLINDDPTEVEILRTNKKYKIHWLKNGQLTKLSRLLLRKRSTEKKENETTGIDALDAILEDNKLACKAAAIYILNGYWKIRFRYWILWRWFYYIKQYDNLQLLPILSEGKKKVPLIQFFNSTTFLIGAKGTLMQMRTEEAERTLQELALAQQEQAQKKDLGSQPHDTSSE